MKKVILLCGAMLLVTAAVANAQLNLNQGNCSGPQSASWGCTSNTTAIVLNAVASITLPVDMNIVTITGVESELELAFTGGTVPLWWQPGTGKCRAVSAQNIGFDTGASAGCNDYFNGNSASYSGNIASYTGPFADPLYGPLDAGSTRFNVIASIPGADAAGATQPANGDQVYLYHLSVNGSRIVGLPSCPGCNVGGCAVLKKVRLTQPAGVGNYSYAADLPTPAGWTAVPAPGFISFQGGGTLSCPHATPTNRSSWGQLKSLYR